MIQPVTVQHTPSHDDSAVKREEHPAKNVEPVGASLGAAAVLLTAAGLFAVIARTVATKEAEPTDQSVHEWAQEHRTAPLDVVTKPITLLSVPMIVVSATAALVWWLHHQDRKDASLAIAFTPLAAAAVGQSFTSFFAQRNPPDHLATGTGEPTEATFPSGHTTGVTAEALAIAYILSREKLASPGVLAALLAWPFVVGVTRLYRDRHWLSDVLAGWVAGTAVAAISVLLYQASTRRSGQEDAAQPLSS